jgi:transcriptional regulator with XRE-family HTH domain
MKHVKLPDNEVRNLHRLRANGWTHTKLAVEFGISSGHVERILNGSQRRDIWLEFHDPQRLNAERKLAGGGDVPPEVEKELDEIFSQFIPKPAAD